VYGIGKLGTALIIGIGVDIVEIKRFARHVNPRFFSRVFTEYEQAYIKNKPAQTMAGLFAAKEAVVKALGTGFSGFWPKEIEIRHTQQGKPCVKISEKVIAPKGQINFSVSISHADEYAVAMVVIERSNVHVRRHRRANAGYRKPRHKRI
jgi:holo-[acyl-carrier protein] synthase